MAWVEKDKNNHLVSTPVGAGLPTSRPGCPEPHPALPWMPPQSIHSLLGQPVPVKQKFTKIQLTNSTVSPNTRESTFKTLCWICLWRKYFQAELGAYEMWNNSTPASMCATNCGMSSFTKAAAPTNSSVMPLCSYLWVNLGQTQPPSHRNVLQ